MMRGQIRIARLGPRVGAATFTATSTAGARSFVSAQQTTTTRAFTTQAHTQLSNAARSESAHINLIRQNAESPLIKQYANQRGGANANAELSSSSSSSPAQSLAPLFPLAVFLVIVPGALTLGTYVWDKADMEDGKLDRAITHVAERVSSKLGDATTEGKDEGGMKRKSSFNRYNSRKKMVAVATESSASVGTNTSANGKHGIEQREAYVNSVRRLPDCTITERPDRQDEYQTRFADRTGMSRKWSKGGKTAAKA